MSRRALVNDKLKGKGSQRKLNHPMPWDQILVPSYCHKKVIYGKQSMGHAQDHFVNHLPWSEQMGGWE